MLTKSMPVFLFTEESIFSHAINIQTIFSSLPFEEIRLSQSQCKELLATALGFADLKQLKEKLKLGTFADIKMPSDAIERTSDRILRLASPLPFSAIEIPDGEEYIYPINSYNNTNPEFSQYKIFRNDLLRIKEDWKDWHIVLGKYICSYLKETLGHFDYFNKLKLSSHLVTFPEQLFHFVNSGKSQSNCFLNSVIYNHLIVHCPTEPNYGEQLGAIPKEQRMQIFDVYLSPELRTYIDKNESTLIDLQTCKVKKKLPLVLSYDEKTETAKINILLNLNNFHRMNKAKFLSTKYKQECQSPPGIINHLSSINIKLDKREIMSNCEFEISVVNKHIYLPEIEGLVWPDRIKFSQDDLCNFKTVNSSILFDHSFGCYLLYFTENGANPDYLISFNEKKLKIPERSLSFKLHFTKRLDTTYTKNEDGQQVSYGVVANLYMRYDIKANLSLELTDENRLNMSFDNITSGIKRNNDFYPDKSPNLALHLETFKLSNPEIRELCGIHKLKASHLKMKGFKETMTNGLPLGAYKQYLQKNHLFTLIKTHQNVMNTYRLIKSCQHIRHTESMEALIDLYEPLEQLETHV